MRSLSASRACLPYRIRTTDHNCPPVQSHDSDRKLQGHSVMSGALAQESQSITLLFQYGVVSATDIITWADSLVEKMDSPPDALLDLSATPSHKTGDILSCLHRLSAGADFWDALRKTLPRLRDFIAAHPDQAENIAHHLSGTVLSFDYSEVPADLRFPDRIDDAFSLARQGTYGTRETAYQYFLLELNKFQPTL